MSRFLAVPALAFTFALLPSSTFAQFGGMGGMGGGGMVMQGGRRGGSSEPSWPAQRWLVKVETVSGRSVLGTLTLASVPINCDLGDYYIKPENVKEIRFTQVDPPVIYPGGVAARGAVLPREGDEIDGTLTVGNWIVETDLGQLMLLPQKLKSVTFFRKAESPSKTTTESTKTEVKIEQKAEKK